MLIRFGALAALVGLGVGALLRLLLGRRRFPLLLTLAHLPLLYHLVRVALAGRRAGVDDTWTLAFVAAGLLLLLVGIFLGRALVGRRPWLAAVMPALVAALYLLGPTVIYNSRLAVAVVALDSLTSFAYILSTILFVALLLPFAPPPAKGPRLPRVRRRR